MGQYFKLVNPDKKEFAELPGLMKPIERVTNPIAMGMIGYLLFQGPLDGTGSLLQTAIERNEGLREEAIESKKEREREIESGSDRQSFYRTDDGWDEQKLARAGMAGMEISEALEYAGRWAGDDVRLVGDYAENDIYGDAKDLWRYEYNAELNEEHRDVGESSETIPEEGEEFVTYASVCCPVIESSLERDDIVHSVRDREPEPGDLAQVRHPDTDDKVYATFKSVEAGMWTNITDGLTEEFVDFVGEQWVESKDDTGLMAPDMVIS